MAKYDIPTNVLDQLKCALCYEYLSYPPITQYAETGNVCGRCPELEAEKNIEPLRIEPYEILASVFRFPCRYRGQGCIENVPMKEMTQHEQSCSFKPYFCPILPLGNCPWLGSIPELHAHFVECHKMMLLSKPYIEVDLVHNYKEHYLIPSKDEVFIFRAEYNKTSESFQCSLHYVGDSVRKQKYLYTTIFQTGDNQWSYAEEPVLPDFNSLLSNKGCVVSLERLREALGEPTTITCMIDIKVADNWSNSGSLDEESEDAISSQIDDDSDKMLMEIECPVCQESMVPPIFQCNVGHSICGVCKPNLKECPTCRNGIGNIRNFVLEKLTERMKYYCRNREIGCDFVANSLNIRKHEEGCHFKPQTCPLDEEEWNSCPWKGNVKQAIPHIRSKHSEYIQNDGIFQLIYNSQSSDFGLCKIMFSYNEMFRICFDFSNESNLMTCVVQCYESALNKSSFMYQLNVVDLNKTGLMLMSKKYCGSMADYQEDMKFCTKWHMDMIQPFMTQKDELKLICTIIKS